MKTQATNELDENLSPAKHKLWDTKRYSENFTNFSVNPCDEYTNLGTASFIPSRIDCDKQYENTSSVVLQKVPTSQGLKKLSMQCSYTRHPHYPEVKLNTKTPNMTLSTMSNSNLSTNNEGGNQINHLRDVSDTNSVIDDVPPQTIFKPKCGGAPIFGLNLASDVELLDQAPSELYHSLQ